MSALDDLIARDSAVGGGSALDAVIARDAGPATAATAPAVAASPWDQMMRQVGLTARMGVSAATGLPTMVGDALNGGINLGISGVNSLAGSHIPALQMPSTVLQNSMTALGVPQPQNALERTVQDVGSAAGGVAPFVGIGKLLANSASPIARAVGSGMSALPGMQITGASGAALGGDIARENDAGPGGQLLGGALGGLAGAIAPSVALSTARGLRGLANNVIGTIEPVMRPGAYVGRQLAQTLGADAPTVANNIRGAPEFVPGSLPTTAQAGANPVLVATEKSFANANPDFKIGMATRAADNNAARWQALNSVARTPEDLADATAARAAVAQPLYDAAHANQANVGPAFMRYAQIPEMQEAMARANSAGALDAAVGRGVTPVWPSPDSPSINGSALDHTSRALGDMIGEAQRAGSNSRVGSLMALKENVDNWMGRYIPGVQDARDAYAAHSSPVNTMQAGQQIAGALGTRALDANGLPGIQLSPYKSALVKAIKDQPYGIDADAKTALQGIGQDLQRATISNSLRSPGSDTAYNIAANGWLAKQLYGENFGGATGLGRTLGAIGAVATGHPYVGAGLLAQGNKLGQLAGSRLNDELGQLMLNPSLLLPYLDAAEPMPQVLLQGLAQRPASNIAQGLLGAAAANRPRP